MFFVYTGRQKQRGWPNLIFFLCNIKCIIVSAGDWIARSKPEFTTKKQVYNVRNRMIFLFFAICRGRVGLFKGTTIRSADFLLHRH